MAGGVLLVQAITELFRDRGTPSELSEVVMRVHRQAVARYGSVDGELMAVALLEDLGGSLLRPGGVAIRSVTEP